MLVLYFFSYILLSYLVLIKLTSIRAMWRTWLECNMNVWRDIDLIYIMYLFHVIARQKLQLYICEFTILTSGTA